MTSKTINMINDIIPTTPQTWTVKITVVEKMLPRQPQSSPNKYQRLILADSSGTRVQATIFGRDIDLLKKNLHIYKKYYISNATVKPIEFKYRMVPHPYQWIIHNRCLIVEVDNDDDAETNIIPLHYVPLLKLDDYKDVDQTIDIIACAIAILPKKVQNTSHGPATIQELILIDHSLQPIVLTMWNQFVNDEVAALSQIISDRPIVAVMRVKVVTYNGLSLSTRATSTLIMKPDVPDATILRLWLRDNNDKINELMASKQFQALARMDDQPIDEITEISSLSSLPDNTVYALKCKLSVTDVDQPFWYMGCSHCHRATSAAYMENFTCNFCKQKNVHGLPRCRITVEASDSTGTIVASIFGEDAEYLISCDAVKVMKMEYPNSLGLLFKGTADDTIVHVKASHNEYKKELKRKFNISLVHATNKGSGKSVVTNLGHRFGKEEEVVTETVHPTT